MKILKKVDLDSIKCYHSSKGGKNGRVSRWGTVS